MKRLTKLLPVLLSFCLVLSLTACNSTNNDSSQSDGEKSETSEINEPAKQTIKRLKKVTTTFDGETESYNLNWEENACNFETYLDYYNDPTQNLRFEFDPETRIYTLINLDDADWGPLPVFQYNDEQKIIKVYNEDDPSEIWDVSYDENNVAKFYNYPICEYNPETKTVKRKSYGNDEYIVYYEATIDEYRNLLNTKSVRYEANEEGVFEKASETTIESYTYDEGGNLIKYEKPESNLIITFEYYDETISHLWERTLPISYIDFFDLFETPFFWYIG